MNAKTIEVQQTNDDKCVNRISFVICCKCVLAGVVQPIVITVLARHFLTFVNLFFIRS